MSCLQLRRKPKVPAKSTNPMRRTSVQGESNWLRIPTNQDGPMPQTHKLTDRKSGWSMMRSSMQLKKKICKIMKKINKKCKKKMKRKISTTMNWRINSLREENQTIHSSSASTKNSVYRSKEFPSKDSFFPVAVMIIYISTTSPKKRQTDKPSSSHTIS